MGVEWQSDKEIYRNSWKQLCLHLVPIGQEIEFILPSDGFKFASLNDPRTA